MTPLWPERPLRNACLIVGSETIQRLRRDQHTEASCNRCLQQGTRADLSCVHARACSREVSRGRFFAIGIYRNRRLHSRRNCFQLWALRCQVSLKFDANLIPAMLCNFVAASAVASVCDYSIRQSKTWNLIDFRCEIFFRASVSLYPNVVGDINVISWNRFRNISLLLFVALFLPWFFILFLRCFFRYSERKLLWSTYRIILHYLLLLQLNYLQKTSVRCRF
jgi:hypothetical protein